MFAAAVLIAAIVAVVAAPLATAAPTGIVVSTSSNRSNAVLLSGATLAGNRYVFVNGYSQARRVSYVLDGGAAVTRSSPFDYAGTRSSGRANPLDTTTLADGSHTLRATVTRSGGAVIADLVATFTVANQTPTAATSTAATSATRHLPRHLRASANGRQKHPCPGLLLPGGRLDPACARRCRPVRSPS